MIRRYTVRSNSGVAFDASQGREYFGIIAVKQIDNRTVEVATSKPVRFEKCMNAAENKQSFSVKEFHERAD